MNSSIENTTPLINTSSDPFSDSVGLSVNSQLSDTLVESAFEQSLLMADDGNNIVSTEEALSSIVNVLPADTINPENAAPGEQSDNAGSATAAEVINFAASAVSRDLTAGTVPEEGLLPGADGLGGIPTDQDVGERALQNLAVLANTDANAVEDSAVRNAALTSILADNVTDAFSGSNTLSSDATLQEVFAHATDLLDHVSGLGIDIDPEILAATPSVDPAAEVSDMPAGMLNSNDLSANEVIPLAVNAVNELNESQSDSIAATEDIIPAVPNPGQDGNLGDDALSVLSESQQAVDTGLLDDIADSAAFISDVSPLLTGNFSSLLGDEETSVNITSAPNRIDEAFSTLDQLGTGLEGDFSSQLMNNPAVQNGIALDNEIAGGINDSSLSIELPSASDLTVQEFMPELMGNPSETRGRDTSALDVVLSPQIGQIFADIAQLDTSLQGSALDLLGEVGASEFDINDLSSAVSVDPVYSPPLASLLLKLDDPSLPGIAAALTNSANVESSSDTYDSNEPVTTENLGNLDYTLDSDVRIGGAELF